MTYTFYLYFITAYQLIGICVLLGTQMFIPAKPGSRMSKLHASGFFIFLWSLFYAIQTLINIVGVRLLSRGELISTSKSPAGVLFHLPIYDWAVVNSIVSVSILLLFVATKAKFAFEIWQIQKIGQIRVRMEE